MTDAQRARKRFNREHKKHSHHSHQVMMKNGKRMAILRPFDVELKMKMVDAIPHGVPGPETDRAWEECLNAQPHRFIGLACKPVGSEPPVIIDPVTKKAVGTLQRGDSFVDYDVLLAHPESKISEDEAKRQMQDTGK